MSYGIDSGLYYDSICFDCVTNDETSVETGKLSATSPRLKTMSTLD